MKSKEETEVFLSAVSCLFQYLSAGNVKEFDVGDVHTNSIEGFWGQLKRSIFGIYHFVSAKYLQRYVDEAVFRYNTREDKESVRFEKMFGRSLNVVKYTQIKEVA